VGGDTSVSRMLEHATPTFPSSTASDGPEKARLRQRPMHKMKGRGPAQGQSETVINVSGENVTVRGFVDSNGMIKIGTAFIP
jgi:hypothetical protein